MSNPPALTDEQLAEIKARADAATVGPWLQGDWQGACHIPEHGRANHPGPSKCKYDYTLARDDDHDASYVSGSEEGVTLIGGHDDGPWLNRADAAFIAHARSDVPTLLAEVSRLTKERDDWKAMFEGAAAVMRERDAAATGGAVTPSEKAQLLVEAHAKSIRDYWRKYDRGKYPKATALQIIADNNALMDYIAELESLVSRLRKDGERDRVSVPRSEVEKWLGRVELAAGGEHSASVFQIVADCRRWLSQEVL